jgi:hypothetical protein
LDGSASEGHGCGEEEGLERRAVGSLARSRATSAQVTTDGADVPIDDDILWPSSRGRFMSVSEGVSEGGLDTYAHGYGRYECSPRVGCARREVGQHAGRDVVAYTRLRVARSGQICEGPATPRGR